MAKWAASSARRGTAKLQFTVEGEVCGHRHAHVECLHAYPPKEEATTLLPEPAIWRLCVANKVPPSAFHQVACEYATHKNSGLRG